MRDRIARAFAVAFVAGTAEFLQAEIDWLVDLERHVGGQNHRLEPWPDKRIEHQFANTAHLAQTRPQGERDMQHIARRVGLRPRRKAVTAQHLTHDPGYFRAAQIAAHGLHAGHPVITAGTFHSLVALIDQHHDGVFVIHLDRRAVFLV